MRKQRRRGCAAAFLCFQPPASFFVSTLHKSPAPWSFQKIFLLLFSSVVVLLDSVHQASPCARDVAARTRARNLHLPRENIHLSPEFEDPGGSTYPHIHMNAPQFHPPSFLHVDPDVPPVSPRVGASTITMPISFISEGVQVSTELHIDRTDGVCEGMQVVSVFAFVHVLPCLISAMKTLHRRV